MDVRVRDTDKRPRMCADGGHTEQARYKARQCAVLGLWSRSIHTRTCRYLGNQQSSRKKGSKGNGNGVRRLGAYERGLVHVRVCTSNTLYMCARGCYACGVLRVPEVAPPANVRIAASMRLGIPGAWDWRKRGHKNRKQIHPSSLSGPYLAIGSGA